MGEFGEKSVQVAVEVGGGGVLGEQPCKGVDVAVGVQVDGGGGDDDGGDG